MEIKFSRKPSTLLFATAWLFFWFGTALLFYQSDPAHHLTRSLAEPSWGHILGFDTFGRDFLSILFRASVTSSTFALIATVVSLLAGLLLGTSIALLPKWIEFPVLRGLDVLLAFPTLLFALCWAALRGPGWDTLIFALLIGAIPSMTRLVNVRTKELLSEDYVLATRSLGASTPHLLWKHLLPSTLSFCGVKAPNLFAHSLIAEATLSFLGIGAPLGHDTWGSLLAQGSSYLIEAPHLALGSGVPLVATVLSLQLLTEKLSHIRP